MSRNRVWVLVALVCALVWVPERAYASDGFFGGLEDLTGSREVQSEGQSYEERYQEQYEPDLREVQSEPATRALDEDATTVDWVNSTVDGFNKLTWASGSRLSWLESVRLALGARTGANIYTLYIVPAVAMVFVWWGVRKAIRMVMGAFRKGSASV